MRHEILEEQSLLAFFALTFLTLPLHTHDHPPCPPTTAIYSLSCAPRPSLPILRHTPSFSLTSSCGLVPFVSSQVVFYLRPTPLFLAELSGSTSTRRPAVDVFLQWCQTCHSNLKVRSKFKCLALVRDLERHNLGWLSPYNGRPVLITDSGRARRGVTGEGMQFLEISTNGEIRMLHPVWWEILDECSLSLPR